MRTALVVWSDVVSKDVLASDEVVMTAEVVCTVSVVVPDLHINVLFIKFIKSQLQQLIAEFSTV